MPSFEFRCAAKSIHRLCFRFGRLLESKKGKSLQDRFRDGLAAPIVLESLKQSIGPPGLPWTSPSVLQFDQQGVVSLSFLGGGIGSASFAFCHTAGSVHRTPGSCSFRWL